MRLRGWVFGVPAGRSAASRQFFFFAPAFFLTQSDKLASLSGMRVPEHPTLIRRMRDARVKKLAQAGPLMAGSLVRIAKHCGRAGCHCQTGQKHVGWYLTRSVNGKTQTTYVPQEMREEVHGWIQEHRRVKQLIQEISELNRALIRTQVGERKRRAGRS